MLQNQEELKEDFDEVPVNENQICYPDEDCLEILKENEDWINIAFLNYCQFYFFYKVVMFIQLVCWQ